MAVFVFLPMYGFAAKAGLEGEKVQSDTAIPQESITDSSIPLNILKFENQAAGPTNSNSRQETGTIESRASENIGVVVKSSKTAATPSGLRYIQTVTEAQDLAASPDQEPEAVSADNYSNMANKIINSKANSGNLYSGIINGSAAIGAAMLIPENAQSEVDGEVLNLGTLNPLNAISQDHENSSDASREEKNP